MRLEAGESVDRYLLISRLGAGGMAEVWLVRHARLGTLHALKVLHSRAAGLRDRLQEALVFERFGMVEEAERAWGESLASDKRCPTLVHTVVAQVSLAEIALKKGDTQSASRFAAEARSRWPTPDAEQPLAQRLMKVEAALARP